MAGLQHLGRKSCSNIPGATSASYTLQASDVNDTVDAVVTATNAGGSGSATSNTMGPVNSSGGTGGPSMFPLKVGSSGRYLETASGTPFLIVGDSPWSLIGNLYCGTVTNGVCQSGSDMSNYFADREAHGFNTALVALVCDDYTSCASSGVAGRGQSRAVHEWEQSG